MSLRSFLLIGSVATLMAFVSAPHVATCTIKHDPVVQALEVTCRINAADLGNALQLRSGQDPQLGDANESPRSDTLIAHYVQDHLRLVRNDSVLHLAYLGKEMVSGNVVCLLQVVDIPSADGLSVSCDLLQELFTDQTNEVRVETAEGFENNTFVVGSGPFTFGMNDR